MKKHTKFFAATLIAVLFLSLFSNAQIESIKKVDLPYAEQAVGASLGEMSVRLIYAAEVHAYLFAPLAENTRNLPNLLRINPILLEEKEGENIPNTAINNLTEAFIKLTIPFYILSVSLVGLYLLFVSGSPLGRARAKSSLIKLIISMGVIFLTIPIIDLLLDISDYLTANILELIDLSPGIDSLIDAVIGIEIMFLRIIIFNYWNALYLMLFSGIIFASVFMVIAVRYFMVIYFTVLFPVSILLFAFYFTRRIGAQMFRTTLAWIFLPPVMALLLVAITVARYTVPVIDDTVKLCFGLAGFMALVIAPLIVVKVMDWLAMLMVILTAIEFPGLHGVIGMIDELQVEGPKTEEITPPPPIKMR